MVEFIDTLAYYAILIAVYAYDAYKFIMSFINS
jgi:hypothetical protein